MLRLLLLITLMVAVFLPSFGAAVKVTDLYQASIPVPAQTPDIRERAVKEAFADVIIKLTGDARIINNPIIQESLQRANYYVQEYNYSSPSSAAYDYLLNVSFQKADIDQILKKANAPLWTENRPLILVWLVVNRGDREGEIVGSETSSVFLQSLTNQSKKIGLPLVFPMMDVTDMSQVVNSDVIEMDHDKLIVAAKRYGADGILVGNVERTRFNLQSRWILIVGSDQWGWKLDSKDPTDLSSAIIHNVSQTITKKIVSKIADPSDIQLTLIINSVNQRNDLIQLMKYLKQLTPVKQTQLSKVSGDSVELSVLISGSVENFQQHTAVGKRLMLTSQEEAANVLVYEWIH